MQCIYTCVTYPYTFSSSLFNPLLNPSTMPSKYSWSSKFSSRLVQLLVSKHQTTCYDISSISLSASSMFYTLSRIQYDILLFRVDSRAFMFLSLEGILATRAFHTVKLQQELGGNESIEKSLVFRYKYTHKNIHFACNQILICMYISIIITRIKLDMDCRTRLFHIGR